MADCARGDRVRSTVDDGFVPLGQTGTVTHGGSKETIRVDWDNHTSSQVPRTSVELLDSLAAGAHA